ncbi:hypothetical protein AVEN_147281-1 [Araneus ventricosus]|uniref:Tc1-like transposase DDE domain-containing protein n=1 Tax=Araneus ventricosus TaxID=182803 RepID=A0A4Y2L8J5_ARAVE|nr:hypothetical protein AVEN_147281-1 [Araneus ventricosus]
MAAAFFIRVVSRHSKVTMCNWMKPLTAPSGGVSAIISNTIRNVWFQHDGAPAHKTSTVKQYLAEEFGDQIIGYGGFQEWPPRSPDPTPMDFSCGDTSNSRCMRPLRQHCRTFNDALRMPMPT